MVLVLALGDLHIPHRAADLPPKFKSMLVPGKIQHIICTGNLCIKEVQDYLKTLCPDLQLQRLFSHATAATRCRHPCDRSHPPVYRIQTRRRVIINPGSATGAYSSITYDVNPSFVLMDVDGLRVVVYVYELIDGEVKVDKIDFKKTASTTHAAH
ncbi:Vacuolar protein sorting-associated protein 29 [Hibiscus syriacus]|uniref:Vacuolar protein sorting-associated protein 29 n=1 Tax=Hibiscus syriacus TaxID=106335 RepID=A0A6A2WQ85_HIBSY|nr:Vacuolar protein sorting-associated protein 29 [Hibiscus syriacus]